jgi:hypothetical protein
MVISSVTLRSTIYPLYDKSLAFVKQFTGCTGLVAPRGGGVEYLHLTLWRVQDEKGTQYLVV